jgi:hypothetical protein
MTATADLIWERAEHGIRHPVTCRLVTSGYDDRYLAMDGTWVLSLGGPSDPDTCIRWATREEAVATLMLLTGRAYELVAARLATVKPTYTSSWEEGPTVTRSGPVRPAVLEAIGELASHAARGGHMLNDFGLANNRAIVATATGDEIACARYWFSECDRLNARTGRAQVQLPPEVQP